MIHYFGFNKVAYRTKYCTFVEQQKYLLFINLTSSKALPLLSPKNLGTTPMKLSPKQDILLNVLFPILAGSYLYFMSFNLSFTGFLRNQLPDGLWAYALISSLLIIWNRKINIFYVSFILIVFISFEALQHLHFISGTGDWLDILIYFSFSTTAILTNKFFYPLPKNISYDNPF